MRLMRAVVRKLLCAPVWYFDEPVADAIEFEIAGADTTSLLLWLILFVWKRAALGSPWPATALAHWHVIGRLRPLWWPVAALEVVQRDIAVGGRIVRAGLIGSVRTLDNCRGIGLGRRSVELASRFIESELSCELTLLLCEPKITSFYETCGFSALGSSCICLDEGKPTRVRVAVQDR